MSDKYIAILGGLVGSSFTIIVTKIFEYFQTQQQHKLSLKRELFFRKLTVFEKTVSYLTIAHTSITNMSVLLKAALDEKLMLTEAQIKNIFDRLQGNIDQVYKVTQEVAGSIDLYVDLEHDEDEVEDVQQFWELLGTISQLAYDVNFGYDLLKTAKTPDEYRKLMESIENNERVLAEKVQSFVDFSNSTRQKYLSLTSLLRAQLKSYE